MPDIFLSYTREDQATAQRFAEAFEAEGLSVWWDAALRSGEAYDQVTEEVLRTARAVVVLWSQKSVASRWVRAEATQADRHRTLVPATIEPCERPIMFELTQTADLSHWTGATNDPAWRAFLADVRRFVEADGAAGPAAPQPTPSAAASGTSVPALAISPFVNRAAPQDAAFADDLAEDLAAALSGSQWMTIVAPSATGLYRQDARDLRKIGRDLSVRYLLEGHVRRTGDSLRIAVQLLEADSGAVLWAHKFDPPPSDLPASQDEFVADLAAHLTVQVQRAEIAHALKKPGGITAWEASMRSLASSMHPTQSRWAAAVADGRRVVELDPRYGFGYARLAAGEAQLFQLRGGDDPELEAQIIDHLRQARVLDPNNPMVVAASAGALLGLGRAQDALPLAERAVAMDPNIEGARFILGQALVRLGRTDEGLAHLDACDHLSPGSAWSTHVSALWRSIALARSGRPDQALEAADRSLRLFPATELLIQAMLLLAKLDHPGPARDALRRLRDAEPEMSSARIAHLVGVVFYGGSDVADEYLAIARRLWGEAECGPKSA